MQLHVRQDDREIAPETKQKAATGNCFPNLYTCPKDLTPDNHRYINALRMFGANAVNAVLASSDCLVAS